MAEVKTSFEILENLKKHIDKLLNEWPEHPTLQTVINKHFNLQHKPSNNFLDTYTH